MTFLRSLAFNAAFYLWTATLAAAFLPALVLPRLAIVAGQRLWVAGNIRFLRRLANIAVEIRGREHIPAGAAIIAAKHQSAWDTTMWHMVLADPAVVMKRELMWIPIYGWYAAKSGMIPVDRKAGTRAMRVMLRAARRARDNGQQIVIFPQGTRVSPGTVSPYHPGVAALYTNLGVPVVPVAVNSGLFWPRRSFLRRPGTIVLEFLEPIPPGLARAVFMAEIEQRIETATRRLEAEGRGENPVDKCRE